MHRIVNSSIRQRKSKAMDMRFYWVQDCVQQGQFRVYWEPGRNNKADYFTKHHPPAHHQKVQSEYLHVINLLRSLQALRGCVNSGKRNPESQTGNPGQNKEPSNITGHNKKGIRNLEPLRSDKEHREEPGYSIDIQDQYIMVINRLLGNLNSQRQNSTRAN